MIVEFNPLGMVEAFALVLLGMSIMLLAVLTVLAVRGSRDKG